MGWWNDRRPAIKLEKDAKGNVVVDENGQPVGTQTMEEVPVKALEDLTLADMEIEFPDRVHTDRNGYRYRILRTNRFNSENKGKRYYNTGLCIVKEIPVERPQQVQDTDDEGNLLTNEDGSPKMITKAVTVKNLVCNPMIEGGRQQGS